MSQLRSRDGRFALDPRPEAGVPLAADRAPDVVTYGEVAEVTGGGVDELEGWAYAYPQIRDAAFVRVEAFPIGQVNEAATPDDYLISADFDEDDDPEEMYADWQDMAYAAANHPDLLPPVLLVEWEDGSHTLVDGYHRTGLALSEGVHTMPAYVARVDRNPKTTAPALPAWTPSQRGLDTRDGSFDQCKHTSAEYTAFLRSQGVDAEWVQVVGPTQEQPAAHPQWHTIDRSRWGHYVTRINNTDGSTTYVDWTARQFDPGADYPLVADDSYAAEWSEEHPMWAETLDRYLADIR